MGTINPAIPTIGQPNSTEDVDIRDGLITIRDEINGNLDNANIKNAANIDGAKLASASVNGSKLVDNSVSPAKISNGTAGQLLVANSSGVITSTTVTGDVTISDTGVTAIGADKVTDTQLRDDASTDANRAVTTNHIRDDAVDANKLRDDASTDGNRAVTTNHIRDGAITTAKVGANQITADKLVAADAAGIGLNTTSITNQRGSASSATERTTTSTAGAAYSGLSLTVARPTTGFILVGLDGEIKSSTLGGQVIASIAYGSNTIIRNDDGTTKAYIDSSVQSYSYQSTAAIVSSRAVGSTSTVTFGVFMNVATAGLTGYYRNLLLWAIAIDIA